MVLPRWGELVTLENPYLFGSDPQIPDLVLSLSFPLGLPSALQAYAVSSRFFQLAYLAIEYFTGPLA